MEGGPPNETVLDGTHAGHEPVEHGTAPRIGGLDGLRAVAVIAVVAYHLWPEDVRAGFLGVDLFMVLSGFLITGLLVDERQRTGAVRLGAFWLRRFRRLVPALLALLTVVAVWVRIAGPDTLFPTVRGQGIASLLYAGNWKLISDGTSYASLGTSPSPLLHLWSLAIEEQFYVVWPLVVLAVGLLARGRRWPLVAVAAGGTIASATLMARWFDPRVDPLRLYYGTDTRAQAFLVGALAALAMRHAIKMTQRVARSAGLAALVVVAAAFVFADTPTVLYRGGFGVFALLAAVVVIATTQPGPVATLLDREPLRLIGRVSYGIYLWHWPVIVLVRDDTTPFHGLMLLTARLTLIAALTALSWLLIECPYKRMSIVRAIRLAPAGVAVACASVFALPTAQVAAYASYDVSSIPASAVVDSGVPAPVSASVSPPAVSSPPALRAAPSDDASSPSTTTTAPLLPTPPSTVMVVGDSGTYDMAPAFVAGFARRGVRLVSTAFPGEGLTRPDGVQDMWRDALTKYQPQLVIVGLGTWDEQFLHDNGWAAYQTVVDSTIGMLTADGAHVLWLSVLPSEQKIADALGKAGAEDRIFAMLPSRYPGVVDYLNIGPTLTAPDGSVPRIIDGHLLRKPDGWHLCPDGAAAIAHTVLTYLGLDSDGWDTGRWRTDARYDNPHGGCPTG